MFIGVEDILQSTADNGEVRVKLGDSRSSVGTAPDAPVWSSGGFVSRPVDPDEDGAAQGLYINDGNKRRVITWRDNRFAVNAGTLEPGESAIVCDHAARVMVKRGVDTGSAVMYTENHLDSDSSMMVLLDGDAGVLSLFCGPSWIKMTKDTIEMSAGGGGIIIDASGVTINGQHFACQTASGSLGVLSLGVNPQPGANSVQYGPAMGVPSVSWAVSP